MKRLLMFATIFVLTVVASGRLQAQSNPFVGNWKLNLAKSKFIAGAPPKQETMLFEIVGDQSQVTVNDVAADGSTIAYKYETPAKGGTGKFLTGKVPFDSVSAKLKGDDTRDASYMKGGKEIVHYGEVISKDGKSMTMTTKGTDAQGNPTAAVLIFEKQ